MEMPLFDTIEECAAYLPTYPKSKTQKIELEFEEDEIAFFGNRADELGCSVEVFIWAVITMHYQEEIRAQSGG